MEKLIQGFENYSIDIDGVVKNIKTGRIMKVFINENGYKMVQLSNNKKQSQHRVHRLLAIHFITNPENKPCINHINGIKTDNRLENLEWCTIAENINHAFSNGLSSGRPRKL